MDTAVGQGGYSVDVCRDWRRAVGGRATGRSVGVFVASSEDYRTWSKRLLLDMVHG